MFYLQNQKFFSVTAYRIADNAKNRKNQKKS